MEVEEVEFLKGAFVIIFTGVMILYRIEIIKNDKNYTWKFEHENVAWWMLCVAILWCIKK